MKKFAVILAVIVGLPYFAWQFLHPSATHRYRLTLVADDNGRAAVGSGVIEVRYWTQPQMLTQASDLSSARGEAVIVDFGGKGLLFCLLRGDDMNSDADRIVRLAFGLNQFGIKESRYTRLRALRGRSDISLPQLPILVRFRNINDPKSVERVDPANLAASFGSGVKFVNAFIEIVPSGLWPLNVFGITGTPLTTGIEKKLMWLDQFATRGTNLDGQRTISSNELSNRLGAGDFKRNF